MRVERQGQGGPFLDEPDTGMAMPVDAALVSLGQTEPAFQAQVVLGRLRIGSDKQPGLETGHDPTHLLLNQIVALSQLVAQGLESPLAFGAGTVGRLQGFLDGSDGGDVALDRLQVVLDLIQSTVDAPRQALELGLGAPPFLTWMFRSSDCRTSRNASAIRRPGGCSGPP